MTPEQRIAAAGGEIVPFAGGATPAPSRFPLIWFADTQPKLESRYIVKGLLGSSALSVIYGESGSGKTYIVLTIALHVALGWPWQGLQTARCGVIYVAAEGGTGALNRIAAFKAHHSGFPAADKVPFAAITAPINLLDPDADVADLIQCISNAAETIGIYIGLIVVDTLSRALAGGEENSSQDMGLFVRNVDRIRAETGAHVLIVHHSGKDQARGARGHSLLRAATDSEIEVSSDEETGTRRMTVRKQRDLPTDGEFAFRLVAVELGRDQDGDIVSSCVVEDVTDASDRQSVKLPDNARLALEKLHDFIAREGLAAPTSEHIPRGVTVVNLDGYRKHLRDTGVTDAEGGATERQQWKRIREKLLASNQIGIWGNHLWMVP